LGKSSLKETEVQEEPKIMFATCRERVAYWEHTDSVLDARGYLGENGVATMSVYESPTYIHLGREKLLEAFLTTDSDYLCFVDSDNILPTESIWRLLQHDLPIVGGLYFKRKGGPEAVAFRWFDEKRRLHVTLSRQIKEWMDNNEVDAPARPTCLDIEDSLLEVDVLGFGAVLIRRDVCEKIKETYGNAFGDHGENIGEDVIFCRRAQDLGYKIYVDQAVLVGHMANYQVTAFDFMQISEWIYPGEEKRNDEESNAEDRS
jgi:hypothetical protein